MVDYNPLLKPGEKLVYNPGNNSTCIKHEDGTVEKISSNTEKAQPNCVFDVKPQEQPETTGLPQQRNTPLDVLKESFKSISGKTQKTHEEE